VKSWLRLLRIALAPSAAADPVAGLVFACGGFPPDARAWWLVPASLGVYHGGLVLNDWADRAHDARTRPGRPIPSGAVPPGAALALAVVLMLAGVACAWLAAPMMAAWVGAVAALAVLYDVAGRGPWIGPFLLGACRAGNLGAGVFWAAHAGFALHSDAHQVGLPLLYGAYVFVVSRLGRLEDGEDPRPIGRRPRVLLTVAAVILVLVPFEPDAGLGFLRLPAHAVAWAGAWGLFVEARARDAWSREDVQRAMGLALRRLLVFTATVALLSFRAGEWDAAIAAAVILAGFPLAHALRHAFPPS
jgi:4-hydroxybenzoate polyprenyltransferase